MWKAARATHQIQHHVAQAFKIIPPTRTPQTFLIRARKNVFGIINRVDLFLFAVSATAIVLSLHFEGCRIREVMEVQLHFHELPESLWRPLALAEENAFEAEIVVGVACSVYCLQEVQHF